MATTVTSKESTSQRRLLDDGISFLIKAGVDSPRTEAEWLLSSLLGFSKSQLYTALDRSVSPEQENTFFAWAARSAAGEPVQYITAESEFFGLPFSLSHDVLIPRPETERVVETAVDEARAIGATSILEIGTGCGCIAVSLAYNLSKVSVTATDSSSAALSVARTNAKINSVASEIEFLEHDFINDTINGRFDLIVSNPPYVPLTDYEVLDETVRDYEPASALTDSKDGLTFYRRFANEGAAWLSDGGAMILEVGRGNHPFLAKKLFHNAGWAVVELIDDYNCDPRVLRARRV